MKLYTQDQEPVQEVQDPVAQALGVIGSELKPEQELITQFLTGIDSVLAGEKKRLWRVPETPNNPAQSVRVTEIPTGEKSIIVNTWGENDTIEVSKLTVMPDGRIRAKTSYLEGVFSEEDFMANSSNEADISEELTGEQTDIFHDMSTGIDADVKQRITDYQDEEDFGPFASRKQIIDAIAVIQKLEQIEEVNIEDMRLIQDVARVLIQYARIDPQAKDTRKRLVDDDMKNNPPQHPETMRTVLEEIQSGDVPKDEFSFVLDMIAKARTT